MASGLKRAAVVGGVFAVGVAIYVAVAGTTGFCPSCKVATDSVFGRSGSLAEGSASGVGATLSSMSASTLDGEAVSLAGYAGKPVILDFWATWCGPCREQRAIFAGMGAEFAATATVVSLSVDTDPALVKRFLEGREHGVELMAPRDLQARFSVSAIPTLVLVDATGSVREIREGVQSAKKLREAVKGLSGTR